MGNNHSQRSHGGVEVGPKPMWSKVNEFLIAFKGGLVGVNWRQLAGLNLKTRGVEGMFRRGSWLCVCRASEIRG
ncbi:MAG: hypothetical protein ACE5GD_09330 [Candidatus Geothermarchaeales archaeon]